MRTSGSLALAALLLTAAPTAAAQSESAPVRIVFRGRFDPTLAALLTSELAANGRAAYVTIENEEEGRDDEPVLEIHLDADGAHAIARPSPGIANAAPIPSDDPDAAALGAASLILEPGAAHAPAQLPAPAALGRELAAPAPACPPPTSTEIGEPAPSPRRGVIAELSATSGAVVNGASVALGAFVARDWLVSVHGRALHLWTLDRLLGVASVAAGYVAREREVDLEVGLEAGVLAIESGANGLTVGALLGGFGGVAVEIDPAVALLARIGVYAANVERDWMPGLLVSLGARVSP